ncbi:TonB-dependent receptor [Halioxenophilus sp. WMMB6]|uniref:TonB-dependent receptor n=1 Tax=Halioxenophilus sp. WMMB6 TaxID=3073815 RepID=UPI00295E9336|nr:TonB-dependent receptor [Halioxenophilus sp. WMMB6]
MKKTRNNPAFVLAPLAACLVINTALAQESNRRATLEEVVVTAQKREQSLQDVPISMNAMMGSKMEASGVTDMGDLSAYVPSFQVAESALANFIYVRGIGSTANSGFEQSVATFFDGVYYGRSYQSRAPFMDLERIEILRGPQSILFGKNAIAGAVNVVSREPTDTFESKINLLYGTDSEQEVSGYISGPLTEKVSGRLAFRDYEVDGFLKNLATGEDDPGKDDQTLRGSLKIAATDTTDLLLKYEVSEFETSARTFQVTKGIPGEKFDETRNYYNTGNPAINKPESQDVEMHTASMTINQGIGDFELTLVTGYTDYDVQEAFDADFSMNPFIQADQQESFSQVSQEIRLTSPLNDVFEYVTGLYWQKANTEYDEQTDFNIGTALVGTKHTDFEFDSETISAFWQGTWHLSSSTRLNTGVRYTSEDKDATHRIFITELGNYGTPASSAMIGVFNAALGTYEHQFSGDRSEEDVSWSINLQHDLTSDIMAYATVSTGYKGGGFDARIVAADDSDWQFEQENAINYEIGGKSTLFSGTVNLNAALFRTQYKDLQVSQFDGQTAFVVGNAAEATVQGLELDGRWQMTDYLSMSGSLAYLDFEYDSFEGANCTNDQTAAWTGPGGCTQDLSGETTVYAPELSGTIGFEFVKGIISGIDFVATLDVNYSDDYYLAPDLDENLIQDAFTKYNASVGVESQDGKWAVSLIGKNLSNELTSVYGNDVPLNGGAYYRTTDRTRSVALKASYKF